MVANKSFKAFTEKVEKFKKFEDRDTEQNDFTRQVSDIFTNAEVELEPVKSVNVREYMIMTVFKDVDNVLKICLAFCLILMSAMWLI